MDLKLLFQQNRYKSLESLPEWLKWTEPIGEQIHSLRVLFGMTQKQLARRSGQYLRMVQRVEGAEVDPRLSSLQKLARGLDCELMIRVVPRRPISKLVGEQARRKAEQIIRLSKGTAAIEEQQPREEYVRQQLRNLIDQLIKERLSSLWDD